MGNKLYVGNLPYGVRDNDLEQAFSQFGAVASARVMMERGVVAQMPVAAEVGSGDERDELGSG